LNGLKDLILELREEYAEALSRIELIGNPGSGESVISLDFSPSLQSSPLRTRVQRAANQLKGKKVEPHRMSPADRETFYAKWIAAFPVRLDASENPGAAAQTFREKMGFPQPDSSTSLLRVELGSEDDLWRTYSRIIAEGELFIPCPRPPPIGAAIWLQFSADKLQPAPVLGTVMLTHLQQDRPGFQAKISPSEPFVGFFRRRAAEKRQGRRSRQQGGKRKHSRFVVKLDVSFDNFPALPVTYAINISEGGAFVMSFAPLPVGTQVSLSLIMPGGEKLQTQAEVVHVVTLNQSAGQTYPPGVNLSFARSDPEFRAAIAQLIDEYERKPPRVLLVDDDDDFREALGDGLRESGMIVHDARTGEEALQKLVDGLFDLDIVLLDLRMPGLDGRGFLDRVRNLGGELDLPILILSAAPSRELQTLKGPTGANDVLLKTDPLSVITSRIRTVLGRSISPSPLSAP
jgi:uncharacterized protein (TIGR02266 family)